MSNTGFIIKEVTFEECLPLLNELWPDLEPIFPIDNIFGRINFTKRELAKIKPRFFVASFNNSYIACTHAYMTSETELRIRGTYCKEQFRRTGITKQTVQYAIDQFPNAKLIYTFPRQGSEKFYEKLGFSVSNEIWPVYKGVRFGIKHIS